MPERINLPGGQYMVGSNPDDRTRHHRQIVKTEKCGCTRSGLYVTLSCGHVLQTFGDISAAKGWLLCLACAERAHENG